MVQLLYCMADNKIWTPKLTPSNKPLYLQIVDALAHDISEGRLSIGDKLPPQRQLAWHLNINHSTVTKAFQQAAKQHLIAGEVGRGTYVLGQSAEAELFNLKQFTQKKNIDLSTHVPIYNQDNNDLEESLNALTQSTEGVNQYLEYPSRHTLSTINLAAAKWLTQLGYSIAAKQCIVTTAAQNALFVSLLNSCKKDEVILVDEFTFPGMKAIAKQLELKLYGIKMDEQGITPEELDLAIRTTGAKVLVSDPTWQNPTATSMGKARQQAIIEVICHRKILFIEEYVIGALSNNPPISATIKSQSVLITSFAKAVSPGVRFAVIAGEHNLITQLSHESHITSWQLSPLMAKIACLWIDKGITKARQTWQRTEINKRYALYKKLFPDHNYPYNKTVCSHVWLPVTLSGEEACEQLALKGVTVVPASLFAVGRNISQFIRVSLTAAKSQQELNVALTILKNSQLIAAEN